MLYIISILLLRCFCLSRALFVLTRMAVDCPIVYHDHLPICLTSVVGIVYPAHHSFERYKT